MTDAVRVSQVFVPGKLPEYTYNPRPELHLETQVEDYIEEAGAILTLAGPTKTGKSVLLRRVVPHAAWIDGQGIDSVGEMWRRIGDELSVFTRVETAVTQEDAAKVSAGAEAGLFGLGKVTGQGEYSATDGAETRQGIDRPISGVVRDVLSTSGRPLVIDDFHFIERAVQRDIVRALKPLVLAGVPIILVSISHRVQDVVTAEPDMTGRVASLQIGFWNLGELIEIARKGFAVLRVRDPADQIATRLAEASYGSPHLMQKFCREICKQSDVREAQEPERELRPPTDWDIFFAAQVDGASADWFKRLLRGPQERGSARTQWHTISDLLLDGYGLTLAAVASTGPKLTLTKDEIKAAIEQQTTGTSPAADQTTRVLQHMSKIAGTRVREVLPSAEELDRQEELDSVPDVQPVLEYVEDGPNSALHIADPFFAHYMRWAVPGIWQPKQRQARSGRYRRPYSGSSRPRTMLLLAGWDSATRTREE